MANPLSHPGYPAARLGLLALALAVLSGCQSLSMNSPQLRVIDASYDSGVLDSYQNNNGLAYNLSFGTVTSYTPMTPGSYTLTADRAGSARPSSPATPRSAPASNIPPSSVTTWPPCNRPSCWTSPARSAGEIAVRFVQQATRSAQSISTSCPATAARNTQSIASNLSFGANSGYLTVPPAPTPSPSSPPELPSCPPRSSPQWCPGGLPSGSVRTVVLIDQEIVGPQRAGITPASRPSRWQTPTHSRVTARHLGLQIVA